VSDKEKLIEVINGWLDTDEQASYDLADRILKAGFIHKPMDLSKRTKVQPKDIRDMVRNGVRPVLVCSESIEMMGIDSPWELGMFARVKSICKSSTDDTGLDITLDLKEFECINDGMASNDWHLKGQSGMGTCKEAGWWKPEDTIWVPVDGFEMEMVTLDTPTA